MDDVIRWIEGDVDDDQVEAIMRALLVNLLDNLPSLLSQVTHPGCLRPAVIVHRHSLNSAALEQVDQRPYCSKGFDLTKSAWTAGEISIWRLSTATAWQPIDYMPAVLDPPLEQGFTSQAIAPCGSLLHGIPISDWDTAGLLKQIQKLKDKDGLPRLKNQSRCSLKLT